MWNISYVVECSQGLNYIINYFYERGINEAIEKQFCVACVLKIRK
ncbi:MAG: hypothetical protein Sylvanvirus1_12 [Sylvanvirus sp.]|uniref:Uncharacterized protein n=1 Tax=Sylvanvirus sp. TaxID=2487774 RepID=A0A3G5AGR6_9VIRU|nr:MAG: hypothetical protein Sylvanvirus1_12 [Sylvanvirus sp.]